METVLSFVSLLMGVGGGLMHVLRFEHDTKLWEEKLHWAVSLLAIIRGDVFLMVFTAPMSVSFLLTQYLRHPKAQPSNPSPLQFIYYCLLSIWQIVM